MHFHILQYYPFTTITNTTPLSGGFANKNYKLQTDRGDFLCRVALQKNGDELLEEIGFLNTLKSNQFPAAYPIPKNDGSWLTETSDGAILLLYQFLEGSEPEPSPITAAEIGRAAARLHQISPEKWKSRQNDLTLKKCRDIVQTASPANQRLKDLLGKFAKETETLQTALSRQQDLPKGIVHGDLYPDNTIFDGDTLVGIIDFEEFCYDTLLFDVGNAIQGFCYKGLDLQHDSLKALIRSYNTIRPFGPEEIPMIPWYIRWAALAQSSWHLRYGLLQEFNDRQFDRVNVLLNRITRLDDVMDETDDIIQATLQS